MKWVCPKCKAVNDEFYKKCNCGLNVTPEEHLKYRQPEQDTQEAQLLREHLACSQVILTTAPFLEGYKVIKTVGIVTDECFCGVNIFKDMSRVYHRYCGWPQ